MAVFKCKMCGGALDVVEGVSVCECAYCGSQQTLPRLADERRANLYDRANYYRRNNEFDKAAGIYEQILLEDNTDAEIYWSLVLCKYGVEYVEAPGSNKRTPTVNRVQYTSIFDDTDYQCALKYADDSQRVVYAAQAREINEIQKGILAISQQEEPYDVFICYKEKDAQGNRTPDSVLAQELYYELNALGYKVFFSRITLENKLGTAYEPYIFAALNSSKVMVVVTTKKEYVNAVWVKNEWSRYLALIKSGERKILVPAYKDMDAYDLPEEFSHLQAQDMSKLGFMQDLVRGIEKIVGHKDEVVPVAASVQPAVTAAPSVAPLLKRAEIFLSDGLFSEASVYCNKVLDMDPENGMAYAYMLLSQLQCCRIEDLRLQSIPFDQNTAYIHALRFADVALVERLTACSRAVKERFEQEQQYRRQLAEAEQQRQWQRMEWERQREELKYNLRKRNNRVHWLMRLGQFLFTILVASIANSVGTIPTPTAILLILGLSFPSARIANKAYLWAVDDPGRTRGNRKACLIVSGIFFTILALVASDGNPDALAVGIGILYWPVAIWFSKGLPKEYRYQGE